MPRSQPRRPWLTMRCNTQVVERAYTAPRFTTAQYGIVWLQAGSARVTYGQRSWDLLPGDAFKRLPARPHDVHFTTGTRTWFLAVPAAVCDLFADCRLPGWDDPVIRPGLDRRIAAGFARLSTWVQQAHGADRMRCLAAMQEHIVLLHELALQGDPERSFLAAACKLLSADDKVTVPAIASSCGMAYSTFRQRFHAALGCSPLHWRIRQRIERAQGLMLDSELGLAAIAEQVGYSDVYRFSRQFRECTGSSPSAWRRERHD